MKPECYLDEAYEYFTAGKTNPAMHSLISGLAHSRNEMSGDEWKGHVAEVREHPALKTTRLCPFTNHAASRPFGYPGDAALIDHIYGYAHPVLSDLPKALYAYTIGASAPRAVRYRRHLLAHLVDKVLHEHDINACILALACGHLRELDVSRLISQIRPRQFVALDQDANSLAEVQRCFAPLGVSTERRNIKEIVVGATNYESLDLAYAAGLYDYLPTDAARRLTLNLFNMLAPEGILLTANFLPAIECVGYMEAAMDWWLTYRDEKDMLTLLAGIPESVIDSVQQYRDPDNNITFLEVRRR